MISESDVSDPLGISRTPVREAFLRLAGEGTLKLFPKRGALIIPITTGDVRDVMEARLLIELWAVSVVAGRRTRESLVSTLCSLLETLQRAASGHQILEYQEADRSFHEAIVTATGNRVIATFYRSLRDPQLRMGAAALVDNDERIASILAEHRKITEAIAAGDTDTATHLMRVHIERTRDALDTRTQTNQNAR